MHIKQNKGLLLFWTLHTPTINQMQAVPKGTQPRCNVTLPNLTGHQRGRAQQRHTPPHVNRGPGTIKRSVFPFQELSLWQKAGKAGTASDQKIGPDLKVLGGLFKTGLLILSPVLKDTCFS